MDTDKKPIPPFGLRMPADLKSWVEEQAKKERRSVNSWLLILIERAKEQQHATT